MRLTISKSNGLRLGTSAAMAIAMSAAAIAPLFGIPASAQLFPSQRYPTTPSPRYPTTPSNQVVIPVGAVIPAKYDEAEKILVTRDETVPITLTVAANIKDRYGTILIPYNSQIVGQIEPAGGGSRFVAQELVINENRRQSLNATSGVVSRTETIERGANAGEILGGAAAGAAAAAAISAILGDVGVVEVLGGAGLGALAGWLIGGNEAELISIDPNSDLNLTLNSSLALR